jgi:hypothetical protein
MPSKSAQQHRFIEAAAHNATFAKKAGIPQKVAKEFVAADKKTAKRTYRSGAAKSERPEASRRKACFLDLRGITKSIPSGKLESCEPAYRFTKMQQAILCFRGRGFRSG